MTGGWVSLVTVVVAVAELFAGFVSLVEDETVAVFDRIVPPEVQVPTLTTSVNCALTPFASEAVEHEIVPPEPTAGVIQFQPIGANKETKVVPAGKVSETVTDAALLRPKLLTVIE